MNGRWTTSRSWPRRTGRSSSTPGVIIPWNSNPTRPGMLWILSPGSIVTSGRARPTGGRGASIMMEPTKREQRQIKRELKRAGSQRRRRQWKRDLRENPEEAPYSEEDFGRYSTAELNGIDRDNTRRRG